MTTTISLAQHIANLNEQLKAKGFTGLVETDLAYWAEMNITTADQYIHMELSTEHYERYAEIHGIKPRWFKYSEMSIQELQFEMKELELAEERMKKHAKETEEHEMKRVQEIKAANAYKPNLAFANLKSMINS